MTLIQLGTRDGRIVTFASLVGNRATGFTL